jgi:hypothetical protein
MRLPKVHGTIKRRLLVNFRIDPDVMQRHLPAPFRPKLHEGNAIAGICLIRLEDIRPRRVPRILGLSSENAAHRVAVVWEDETGSHEGVYIPRRDTGSLVNHLAGGRLFPGEHQRAKFYVEEDEQGIALHMRSADQLPETSVFRTVGEASAFFEAGGVGYSVTSSSRRLEGVVLKTESWSIAPHAIESAHTSYFADREMFPADSIGFDCALVMRNIPHEWETAAEMYV